MDLVPGRASRNATALFSRNQRWRRHRRRSMLPVVLLLLLALGSVGFLGAKYLAAARQGPDVSVGKDAEALGLIEARFPEAVKDETRILRGVAVSGRLRIALVLPAHLLEAPLASADPMERLSAPFIGAEPSLSRGELAARIERLAGQLSAPSETGCYTYLIGGTRRIERPGLRVRVRDLAIDLGLPC